MKYKIEATTTRTGNVLTFKVYERKKFLIINYWKFMCNQSSYDEAENLVIRLREVNQ